MAYLVFNTNQPYCFKSIFIVDTINQDIELKVISVAENLFVFQMDVKKDSSQVVRQFFVFPNGWKAIFLCSNGMKGFLVNLKGKSKYLPMW